MSSLRRTIKRAHMFKGMNAKQKRLRRMELKRERNKTIAEKAAEKAALCNEVMKGV